MTEQKAAPAVRIRPAPAAEAPAPEPVKAPEPVQSPEPAKAREPAKPAKPRAPKPAKAAVKEPEPEPYHGPACGIAASGPYAGSSPPLGEHMG
jgi:hypothetical protein